MLCLFISKVAHIVGEGFIVGCDDLSSVDMAARDFQEEQDKSFKYLKLEIMKLSAGTAKGDRVVDSFSEDGCHLPDPTGSNPGVHPG